MNKIFKVIWNPATGNYTVTSETAKSRGKKSGRSKLLISAPVAGGMFSSFGANASASLDGGTFSDPTEITDVWVAIGGVHERPQWAIGLVQLRWARTPGLQVLVRLH